MVLPFFPCPFHRYYCKEECKRRDFVPVFSEDVARSLPPLFFCSRRYFPWKTNISLLTHFLQSHVSASMLERNVRAFRMSKLCLLLDVSRMSSAALSLYTHGVFRVRKPRVATVAVNGALVWRPKTFLRCCRRCTFGCVTVPRRSLLGFVSSLAGNPNASLRERSCHCASEILRTESSVASWTLVSVALSKRTHFDECAAWA